MTKGNWRITKKHDFKNLVAKPKKRTFWHFLSPLKRNNCKHNIHRGTIIYAVQKKIVQIDWLLCHY